MDTLPRTPPGRVVDPMTTKLEHDGGYLAGRQGRSAESIRRELEDPNSEASRWLESIQRKSQAILIGPADGARSDLACFQVQAGAQGPIGLDKASSVSLWRGCRLGDVPCNGRGLAHPGEPDPQPRSDAGRARRSMGNTPGPAQHGATRREKAQPPSGRASKPSDVPSPKSAGTADGSTGLALARIEAKLGELQKRSKEAQSSPNQSEPSIEELKRDVERLRNETEARAQSTRQETHELGLVVQEVLQLLRGLAVRPWGPDQMQGSVPGQGQMFDQNHFRFEPGKGGRMDGSRATRADSQARECSAPADPDKLNR